MRFTCDLSAGGRRVVRLRAGALRRAIGPGTAALLGVPRMDDDPVIVELWARYAGRGQAIVRIDGQTLVRVDREYA